MFTHTLQARANPHLSQKPADKHGAGNSHLQPSRLPRDRETFFADGQLNQIGRQRSNKVDAGERPRRQAMSYDYLMSCDQIHGGSMAFKDILLCAVNIGNLYGSVLVPKGTIYKENGDVPSNFNHTYNKRFELQTCCRENILCRNTRGLTLARQREPCYNVAECAEIWLLIQTHTRTNLA